MHELTKTGKAVWQKLSSAAIEWNRRGRESDLSEDLLGILVNAHAYEQDEGAGLGPRDSWSDVPRKIKVLNEQADNKGLNMGRVIREVVVEAGYFREVYLPPEEAALGWEFFQKRLDWEQAGYPEGGLNRLMVEFQDMAKAQNLNFGNVLVVSESLRKPLWAGEM